MTVGSKEKFAQSPPVLVEDPIPEVKEILKYPPSFSYENEIQNIKIPVPFSELIKIEEVKKCLSKMLLSESYSNTTDLVNIQNQNPVVILGPLIEYRYDSSPPLYVRKIGPRSNKIKQMQKQNTEDTQYKRDTDLRGSPSVGYVHQRNCQVLPLLLSKK
jgi:hypothetical protein